MGKTFHKITLCSTNDFKANKNDKIRGWVENNGGTFSTEIDHRVTHLVCSSKAWKRDIPIVKAARRQKTVKIVSLNWLEDSLMSKTRKPLSVEKYSWVQRHWKRRQAEKAKQSLIGVSEKTGLVLEKDTRKEAKDKSIEKAGKLYDDACKELEEKMSGSGYHIHTNSTGSPYAVSLIRSDIHSSCLQKHWLKVRPSPFTYCFSCDCKLGKSPYLLYYFTSPCPFSSHPTIPTRLPYHTRKMRVHVPNHWAVCLQLFESDTTPKQYAAFSTHLDRDGKVTNDVIAPKGSDLGLAKDAFKMFFKLRTGVEWASRGNCHTGAVANPEATKKERSLSQDGVYEGDGGWSCQSVCKGEQKTLSPTMDFGQETVGEWLRYAKAKTPDSGW